VVAVSAALATRNVSDFDGTGIELIDPGFSRQNDEPASQHCPLADLADPERPTR
jgi:hypothetical protein